MMQKLFNDDQTYMSEHLSYDSNTVNQDLMRLREMNEAFSRMNENNGYSNVYEGQEYYTYDHEQRGNSYETSELTAREVYSVQQSLEHKVQGEDVTERSNSLLFTLSEKDEEETRPATNVQHGPFEYEQHPLETKYQQNYQNYSNQHINKAFQAMSNQYEQNESRQSITVNNTLANQQRMDRIYEQQSFITRPPTTQRYTEQIYYDHNTTAQIYLTQPLNYQVQTHNQYQEYAQYPQQNQHQISTASNGFSRYQEFAVKISKLFNINVEDLELIYNQLKFEKQAEVQSQSNIQNAKNLQTPASHSNSVQISDSEVMKKLFSYALQIKNQHSKLKNMITIIDHRKSNNKVHYDHQAQTNQQKSHQRTNYERAQTQITPQKVELQNISINFMLEEDHHNVHANRSHQFSQPSNKNDNETQRIQMKKHKRNESQDIQSKKTIIDKLVGNKGNLNSELLSQQTILTHSSFADSVLTNTKTNKSKKKSRMNEKIKLISQQLESLKKEMDQEEEVELNFTQEDTIREVKEEPKMSNFYSFKEDRFSSQPSEKQLKEINDLNGLKFSFDKQSTQPSYLPSLSRETSEYVIQVNHSESKPVAVVNPVAEQPKVEVKKESEFHTFGGESFTYVKSIEQLPMDDPEIDLKIQQTIKTCIVKSPKKIISQPTYQQIPQNPKFSSSPIASQEKKSQKLIVEPAPTSNSRSKYSFKLNSQISTKDHNETTVITSPAKSESREKMFKSIAEMRKSNQSKEKSSNQVSTNNWTGSKTTNNAYLDDENNSGLQKSRSSLFAKNVFENSAPISYEKISTGNNLVKPKFYTKQVMRDGKLVFEKTQISQSQHKIRQTNDERRQTATFGAVSPSESDKYIKTPQFHQSSNSTTPNLYSSYAPPTVYQTNIAQHHIPPVNSEPVSNTQLQDKEANNRKTFSMGGPSSSLYSAKTIESRPFIESENHLLRSGIKGAEPVYVMHNSNQSSGVFQKQKYEYKPKMMSVKQIPNTFSNILFNNQQTPVNEAHRSSLNELKMMGAPRPVTPQGQPNQFNHSGFRPATPINRINNLSIPVQNDQKQKSFSVEKIQSAQSISINNFSFKPNFMGQNGVIQSNQSGNFSPHPQIRMMISPSKIQQNNVMNNPITVRPSLINPAVTERRMIEKPFSVPIRSMTPERGFQKSFKETLIEKPKVLQNNFTQTESQIQSQNFVKRESVDVPVQVQVSQFDLRQQVSRQQVQNKQLESQLYQSQSSKAIVNSNRNIEGSRKSVNEAQIQSVHHQQQAPLQQSSHVGLGNSKHLPPQIPQFENFPSPYINREQMPSQTLTNNLSQPQLRNPRLEQSEMYYRDPKSQIRTPVTEIPTNYKQMNLMSSRRADSVVHTFPVQMENSKMNNSIYTKEELAAQNYQQQVNEVRNKLPYGEIITYQPQNDQFSQQQPIRIPNGFRPPKYIPPKQQTFNQQINLNNQKPTPYPSQDSSRPPIKTYTMGHLLQASKTQQYMKNSIIDDKKSNTALNSSNIHGKINDLHDSTPSFGRTQQDGSNSLVISPFSKDLSHLNYSRQSLVSKRSSSSRSRSNKKGIALESKRSRSPSHKFYQSSYDQ